MKKIYRHPFLTRDELLSRDAIASNYRVIKEGLDTKYHPFLEALVKHSLYYGAKIYAHDITERREMLMELQDE